ncbi:Serine acetyltransferase 2 [Capsicum annuum]|nr:Serine acetyltransferase 2 [Capsicum annuum]KAF3682429.1 Serine acetyltransferase 2 [Capsicum annuum]
MLLSVYVEVVRCCSVCWCSVGVLPLLNGVREKGYWAGSRGIRLGCVAWLVVWAEGITLVGIGKETGDRHPKIGQGALIGASVTILGNIKVGEGAMVGANSLVMKDVPLHSMVIGIPAKMVGYIDDQNPSLNMKHDVSKEFFQKVAISCKEARSNGSVA